MGKSKEIFLEKRVVRSSTSIALGVFDEICHDFTEFKGKRPSDFMADIYDKFKLAGNHNVSINGKVFEYMISAVLLNENLLPFYAQAKVAFVPNADYDFLLYCKEKGPIVLSAKTTLRERYKQADLEAVALKYVYRKSESYLITMDENEARHIQEKVLSGDVIGINEVIYAASDKFNEFIERLKTHKFEKAGSVEIVTAGVTVE